MIEYLKSLVCNIGLISSGMMVGWLVYMWPRLVIDGSVILVILGILLCFLSLRVLWHFRMRSGSQS